MNLENIALIFSWAINHKDRTPLISLTLKMEEKKILLFIKSKGTLNFQILEVQENKMVTPRGMGEMIFLGRIICEAAPPHWGLM